VNTVTQELARAWRRYFTTQESPRLSPEIASVVIVEDLTKGPYPPARLFQIGGRVGAQTGAYSVITIANTGGRGSVVVIDRLYARGVGSYFQLGVRTETYGITVTQGSKIALDRAPEALSKSYNSGQLFIGDVRMQFGTSLAAVGWDTIPTLLNGPALNEFYAELEGPWTLGQDGEMALMTGDFNVPLFVFAVGRYYTLS